MREKYQACWVVVRARLHLVGTETLLGNLSLLGNGSFQHDYGYKEVPLTTDAMRKIFKDNASEKSEQIDEIHNFSVVFYSEPVISR